MNATTAFVLPALAAFFFTVLLVPPIRRICARWRIYDLPGPLKIHSVPIPRLGGIAIAAAIAISTGLFSLVHPSTILTWPFFAALALIWTVGLADDLRGLSPLVRIVAQIAAAGLLWWTGWGLPMFGPGILGLGATCLFILIFVNGFNFLDGSDGLAAGVTGVVALAYIALPSGMSSGFGRAVASSLFAACAGFLIFNFPPAKIFMGDSGCMVLGFTVACLALDFFRAGNSPAPALFFPILVAALPLLDACIVILRRIQRHESPLIGDRQHFYDLLLSRGWSARKILLACVAISAAFAVVASVCLRCTPAHAALLAASSLAAQFVWIVRLGLARTTEERPQAEEITL